MIQDRYMLDTNTVSHLVRQQPKVVEHVVSMPMTMLCISAITAGELLFGLARLSTSSRLHRAVREFLERVEVLPWDIETAEHYAVMRAEQQRKGALFGPMDMLIAAHALAVGAVLVSSDRAFRRVVELRVEDWTI